MVEYSLEKLLKLRHLSEFTGSEIFTELGLYQDIVIDTYDVWSYRDIDESNGEWYIQFEVGKDIKELENIMFSTEAFMLPCPKCQHKQAFKNEGNINKSKIELPKYYDEYIEYLSSLEEDYLMGIKYSCKNQVLNYKKFSLEYICPLNPSHRVYGDFIIEEIVLKEEHKKNTEKEEYKKTTEVEGYVILRKIGQYPSMKDMQFFECKEYKNILGKDNHRNYTMALGLYASGVGCGSFLYLRRVLEFMVEKKHKKYLDQEGWDEKKYEQEHFKERLDMLEKYEKIIPDELNEVRNKLYGVLSKGVHESTEDDCKKLFPFLKCAIDIILNEEVKRKKNAVELSKLKKEMHVMCACCGKEKELLESFEELEKDVNICVDCSKLLCKYKDAVKKKNEEDSKKLLDEIKGKKSENKGKKSKKVFDDWFFKFQDSLGVKNIQEDCKK